MKIKTHEITFDYYELLFEFKDKADKVIRGINIIIKG